MKNLLTSILMLPCCFIIISCGTDNFDLDPVEKTREPDSGIDIDSEAESEPETEADPESTSEPETTTEPEPTLPPVTGANNLPAEIAAVADRIIFTENFDGQPDWFVGKNARCLSGNGDVCSNRPNNWDYYYSGERFHPDDLGPDYQPSAQISGFQARGGSGKSYITFDESYGGPSQWGSDAVLAKDLGAEYKDLYAEFWIKFEPGYVWAVEESGNGQGPAKIARFSSYQDDPNGSRFSFFSDGAEATPLSLTQLKVYVNGRQGWTKTEVTSLIRCSPIATNYQCDLESQGATEVLDGEIGSFLSFDASLANGQWHKWAWRTRYSSAPGVADGLTQAWIDGVKVLEYSDIDILAADSRATGFNNFMIGGNMNNVWCPEEDQCEQWLAYDDIAVWALK